jgi:hypothetical protein
MRQMEKRPGGAEIRLGWHRERQSIERCGTLACDRQIAAGAFFRLAEWDFVAEPSARAIFLSGGLETSVGHKPL